MALKEFKFRGKSLQDLQALSHEEFAELITSRPRRTLKRGLTDNQKKLLEKIRSGAKQIKTHEREMVILPEMVGASLQIYNGKTFVPVTIVEEMVGHILGEFSLTRSRVAHNAPGVGATRSSGAISVR